MDITMSPLLPNRRTKTLKSSQSKRPAGSEHVQGFGAGRRGGGVLSDFLSVVLLRVRTPREPHVWQIRPTIMGNVCGAPDRLHVT